MENPSDEGATDTPGGAARERGKGKGGRSGIEQNAGIEREGKITQAQSKNTGVKAERKAK